MAVVVVESPSKAKTINKYLGKDFTVLASFGHVRDLPAKDGSVKPDEDFSMDWEVDSKSAKRLADIAAALKNDDKLVLATDPDREGEAISWHVLEVLTKKGALKGKKVERVAFNAITKSAILEAMANPRALDTALVDAYLARRALDYLVGFTLSPVLWRKLPGSRSAGRVQSVALRIICDRELEIEAFRPQEYWTIDGVFTTSQGAEFQAGLSSVDGKRLEKLALGEAGAATAIASALKGQAFKVDSLESKPAKRHPFPPFRTSTLQQEASRKLGFSSARTMQIAQRLYEGVELGGETVGLITYMRTDGVDMAPEAIAAARNAILKTFGEPYVPSVPRKYTSKAKNAQEAHEAIRPTELSRHPDQVRGVLEAEQLALYDLIWKRTIASQMESAEMERTSADIGATGSDGKHYAFRATGSVVKFDGFLRAYTEDLDDDSEDEDAKRLPAMARGDATGVKSITPNQHHTEPPPRYSEATLIKRLEELGIGRPSTYVSILKTLTDRGYMRIEKKRLIPDDKGRVVTGFLESFFKRYVEYDFTANLEEQLDQISAGEMDYKEVLRQFWKDFTVALGEVKDLRITQVIDTLNDLLAPHIFPARADGGDPRACPSCADGRLSLKLGRFGSFIGCTNYPTCNYTRQMSVGAEGAADAVPADGIILGQDPETGQNVTRRIGRFGPYLQLGETVEGEKPTRASIPRATSPASITLEQALRLLSLPREVGIHPETQTPIVANFGRFGPFILHDGVYANLKDPEEVYTIGLNRAVDLLAEKRAKGPSNRARPGALRSLGDHPDGGKVEIFNGKYGAYVKHANTNATLPKDTALEAVTMEQAIALLAERAEKSGKKPAKKAAKKKPAKRSLRKLPRKNQQKLRPPVAQKPKRDVEPRSGLPTAAELMQYITATPGTIGKGDIARAFGIKGADKMGLKKMLKDLSGSGQVTRQKRSFASKTRLPPVGVVEITGEDEGELTGQLVGDDGMAQGPALLVKVSEGRSPKRGERAVAKFELLPRHAGYSHQAKIMRILPQKAGRLLGVLQLIKSHGARISPVDKKARTEYQVMSGDEAGATNGELVAFEIIRERGFGLPAARVIDKLGDLNDPKNISLIAINQHGIPNQFPQRVLDEAEALKVFNGSGREDFTKVPLITIDPADARDHDDAVFAEADGDGGFKVIVAIADVAHYVLPATALDREARLRGNSVYFPDLVVPMLPERISNDLCSLREGELRPALACVMHFNSAGNKTAHQFHRVAMRSAAKLSYEEAQVAIDGRRGPKTDDLLEGVLKPLWAAYRCLKKAQDKRSPLALDLPERKIILDDKGNIQKVVVPPRLDAHRLIEEFMIQANVSAAEELEKRRTPLLYRVHESPSPEKLKNLATFLRTVQREWALGQSVKPAQFNRLLESVKGEDFELLIHEIVLRTQMQATYKPDNLGHFGLALSRYAHFTSPIRRYADLIVHRALIKALGFGNDGLSVQDIEQLEDTAEMLATAERRAMIAERETNDRLIAAWLAPQVGATFHGKISGAVGAGLFVVLDGSGADGFVPVSGLGRDYFVFDEVAHALRGRSTGETFQLGDRVEVKLLEVAPVKGGLRFEMVSAGRAGKPPRHVKKGKRR